MKWIAEGWVEPFKECVEYIPEHAQVKSIELEDWVPGEGMWENWEGRRTLIGDAAHTMTMCTFSPLNFPNSFWNIALTSPSYLSPRRSLQPLRSGHRLPPLPPPPCAQNSPIHWKHLTQRSHLSLRTRMIQRTAPAVLNSRRACLDAHDYKSISEASPLVGRRAMEAEKSE